MPFACMRHARAVAGLCNASITSRWQLTPWPPPPTHTQDKSASEPRSKVWLDGATALTMGIGGLEGFVVRAQPMPWCRQWGAMQPACSQHEAPAYGARGLHVLLLHMLGASPT